MPTPALPTPRPPLMTAEERYEQAKRHAFIRAHLQLARIFLEIAAEKKEDARG